MQTATIQKTILNIFEYKLRVIQCVFFIFLIRIFPVADKKGTAIIEMYAAIGITAFLLLLRTF